MSLAIALKNRQQARLTVRPSVVDADGQRILKADGTQLDPSEVPITWERTAQDRLDPNADPTRDVSWLEGVEENGQKLIVRSGLNGTASFAGTIGPYPDGSTKLFTMSAAIGASEPGDPTSDVSVEDEPTAVTA